MNTKILYILISFVLIACAEQKAEKKEIIEDKTPKVSLTKVWETDTVFTTAESAIYHKATNTIYVSNIEEGPWEADGKGSIGKLGLDGKVIDARWITGLNAPKGLGIVGDNLYFTDLQDLVEISISSGEIIQRYPVEGAKGVNDVTTGPDGTVYFTDSNIGNVYSFKDGKFETLLEGLPKSNGIFYEKDRLLIGTWNDEKLNAYLFADKSLETVSSSLPQPDGIEATGDGGFLVSSWKGLLHYVGPDGSNQVILDTVADEIGTADIDYIQEENLVIVPTFFHNTVAAYKLNIE